MAPVGRRLRLGAARAGAPGLAWGLSALVHAAALGLTLSTLRAPGPAEPPSVEYARGEPLRVVEVRFVPMTPPPLRAAPSAPSKLGGEPPTPAPPLDAPMPMPQSPSAPDLQPPDLREHSTSPRPFPSPERGDTVPPPQPVRDGPEQRAAESPSEPGIRTGARLLDLPAPEYPSRSRRLGEEGLVLLEVEVLADGRAGTIRVLRAPPYPRLVTAAVEAARKARFRPATEDGAPVRSLVQLPIRFRLK
jgi:protein TonB